VSYVFKGADTSEWHGCSGFLIILPVISLCAVAAQVLTNFSEYEADFIALLFSSLFSKIIMLRMS
jgi:hypothetical protein